MMRSRALNDVHINEKIRARRRRRHPSTKNGIVVEKRMVGGAVSVVATVVTHVKVSPAVTSLGRFVDGRGGRGTDGLQVVLGRGIKRRSAFTLLAVKGVTVVSPMW